LKQELRRTVLERRDALTQDERAAKSAVIAEKLRSLIEYRAAETILFYVEFRSEVITRPMIDAALRFGKKVLVPKVDKSRHRLRLFELYEPHRELIPGYMGIPEPDTYLTREADVDEVEMVVVPGVAFDTKCWRLGYGGGYYDRMAVKLRPGTPLVGLAFEAQIVDEIPQEKHDRPMKVVVTEERELRP
jgi:5-formyltetrahydrofolate cyclo-ligase